MGLFNDLSLEHVYDNWLDLAPGFKLRACYHCFFLLCLCRIEDGGLDATGIRDLPRLNPIDDLSRRIRGALILSRNAHQVLNVGKRLSDQLWREYYKSTFESQFLACEKSVFRVLSEGGCDCDLLSAGVHGLLRESSGYISEPGLEGLDDGVDAADVRFGPLLLDLPECQGNVFWILLHGLLVTLLDSQNTIEVRLVILAQIRNRQVLSV